MIDAALARCAAPKLAKLAGFRVLSTGNLDGIKFYLDAPTCGNGADAWVLFRASGTEPLMRIYCEAASPAIVKEILDGSVAFVEQR